MIKETLLSLAWLFESFICVSSEKPYNYTSTLQKKINTYIKEARCFHVIKASHVFNLEMYITVVHFKNTTLFEWLTRNNHNKWFKQV